MRAMGKRIDVMAAANNPAEHDIAIIGGGVNCRGIARDATRRGWRAPARDSGASTKLIHGGPRYLEHPDFRSHDFQLAHRRAGEDRGMTGGMTGGGGTA